MSANRARWMSGWLLVLLAACCSWVVAAEPGAQPNQQEADKVLADIRAAIVNHRTNEADIDALVAEILRRV